MQATPKLELVEGVQLLQCTACACICKARVPAGCHGQRQVDLAGGSSAAGWPQLIVVAAAALGAQQGACRVMEQMCTRRQSNSYGYQPINAAAATEPANSCVQKSTSLGPVDCLAVHTIAHRLTRHAAQCSCIMHLSLPGNFPSAGSSCSVVCCFWTPIQFNSHRQDFCCWA